MENKSKTPWWQPGLLLFLRLSSWIVGPVIAAVFVGKFLDRIFGTSPWLFFVTVAIAFIVSIVMIVKIGLEEMRDNHKSEAQNPKSETNSNDKNLK